MPATAIDRASRGRSIGREVVAEEVVHGDREHVVELQVLVQSNFVAGADGLCIGVADSLQALRQRRLGKGRGVVRMWSMVNGEAMPVEVPEQREPTVDECLPCYGGSRRVGRGCHVGLLRVMFEGRVLRLASRRPRDLVRRTSPGSFASRSRWWNRRDLSGAYRRGLRRCLCCHAATPERLCAADVSA